MLHSPLTTLLLLTVVLSACDDKDPVDTGDGGGEIPIPVVYFADVDGDGFGDAQVYEQAAEQPEGFVEDSTDCDDTNAEIYPGADERCNGEDDDCDDSVDEDAVDISVWYADADADSYGDPLAEAAACTQPEGHVEDSTDCDDTNAEIFPGADERCNDADDDCDSEIDEDPVNPGTWHADTDGDSYGDRSSTTQDCDRPSGYVLDSTDCDDTDPEIYPGAEDRADGIDQDCDGDDGFAFDEDLESYAVGDFIGLDSRFFATWTTGEEGGEQDVPVTDVLSHSTGSNTLKFDEDEGDDLVLLLGPESGSWVVSWAMYAEGGAYFNLQGTTAPWGDWQVQIYIDEQGEIFDYDTELVSLDATIPVDDWVLVELYVDLDLGTQEMYIDGDEIYSDSFGGIVLGGIDFFPTSLSTKRETPMIFYIDDVSLEEAGK